MLFTSRNVWLNSDLALAIKSDNSLAQERLNECVDNFDRGDFILPSSASMVVTASAPGVAVGSL